MVGKASPSHILYEVCATVGFAVAQASSVYVIVYVVFVPSSAVTTIVLVAIPLVNAVAAFMLTVARESDAFAVYVFDAGRLPPLGILTVYAVVAELNVG